MSHFLEHTMTESGIKQRNIKIDTFNNVDFGYTSNIIIDGNKTNNYRVSNLTLKITLGALYTGSTSTGGYVNWVDSIGHSIIETLDLKIGGVPIYSSFPYGLWLDLYNELNDPHMNEWSLIGKNESTVSLKKLETKKRIIYVPLHIVNEGVQNSLPLTDSADINIKIKLRSYESVIIFSADHTKPSKPTIDMDLIYELVETKERANNVKTCIEVISHFSYRNPSGVLQGLLDYPVKELVFVLQNSNRAQESSTPRINELVEDVNGNDWLNYSGTSLSSELNTGDPFINITDVKINSNSYFNSKKNDALFYRQVLPFIYHENVPKKHIYTIPLSTLIDKKNTVNYGNYFNLSSGKNIQIIFDTLFTDTIIHVFSIGVAQLNFNDIRVQLRKIYTFPNPTKLHALDDKPKYEEKTNTPIQSSPLLDHYKLNINFIMKKLGNNYLIDLKEHKDILEYAILGENVINFNIKYKNIDKDNNSIQFHIEDVPQLETTTNFYIMENSNTLLNIKEQTKDTLTVNYSLKLEEIIKNKNVLKITNNIFWNTLFFDDNTSLFLNIKYDNFLIHKKKSLVPKFNYFLKTYLGLVDFSPFRNINNDPNLIRQSVWLNEIDDHLHVKIVYKKVNDNRYTIYIYPSIKLNYDDKPDINYLLSNPKIEDSDKSITQIGEDLSQDNFMKAKYDDEGKILEHIAYYKKQIMCKSLNNEPEKCERLEVNNLTFICIEAVDSEDSNIIMDINIHACPNDLYKIDKGYRNIFTKLKPTILNRIDSHHVKNSKRQKSVILSFFDNLKFIFSKICSYEKQQNAVYEKESINKLKNKLKQMLLFVSNKETEIKSSPIKDTCDTQFSINQMKQLFDFDVDLVLDDGIDNELYKVISLINN